MSNRTTAWVSAGVTASLCFLGMLITRDVIGRGVTHEAEGVPLQTEQALNLKPYRTFIRTQNDLLTLTVDPQQAFLSTSVTCPSTATKGCTLKVAVSGRFGGVSSQCDTETLTIAGGGQPPDPDSSISVDCSSQNPEVRTFQWMQRSVPAASTESVTVQFTGSGQAYDRTEVIDVYTN